jgi:UDP-3-O-[3-hydroxymyristoyl] N-acetylglucosamine deacetylase
MFLQRTLKQKSEVTGIGLHSGKPCKMIFKPAPPDIGVYFIRADLPHRPSIKAFASNVRATTNATTLGSDEFSVLTVEHCLSALAAFQIDNLYIELDGPEIPVGDGSAEIFLRAIQESGFVEQSSPRKYIYVKESLFISDGEKQAYVQPYDGLRITCTIEFPHPLIGKQKIDIDINETSFVREIARARTFGFVHDLEAMQKKGLALGASLDNAIGLDKEHVLNPEGLR